MRKPLDFRDPVTGQSLTGGDPHAGIPAILGAVPPDPGGSHEPKSRIKIFVGRSGGMRRQMRRTLVELPFTELNPTMTSQGGQAVSDCQRVLERLRPAEREVVLSNLLAKFGELVPE